MTIQPDFFTIFFYIIVLFIGLDFTLSGILLLKDYTKSLEKPRLLGLLSLKFNQKMIEKMQNSNQVYQSLYSYKIIRFYILMAGVIIIVGSIIAIIDIYCR